MKSQENSSEALSAEAQIDAFANALAMALAQKATTLTQKLFPQEPASALVLFMQIAGAAAGVLLGLAEGSVSEGPRAGKDLSELEIEDIKRSQERLLSYMKSAMERNRNALLAASKDAAAIRYGRNEPH